MRSSQRNKFLFTTLRTFFIFILVAAAAFAISSFFLSDFSKKLLSATVSDARKEAGQLGDFIADRLAEGFISPNDRARIRERGDKYGFIYIVAADSDGGVVFSMGIQEAIVLGKLQQRGIFPMDLQVQGGIIPVYDIAVGMPGGRILHAGIPQGGLAPELATVTDEAGGLLRLLFALALGLISVAVAYAVIMVQRVKNLRSQVEHQRRLAYLGEIAGSLAHEIRNPLNTINMNIQLLEEMLGKTADDKTKLKLTRVKNEIIRLDGILTSFLRFARPPKLSVRQIDTQEFLNRIYDFVAPEIQGKGIVLELDIPEDLPPIHGDPEQLKQLFLNLLLNARDATRSGGKISIKASRTSRRIHVAISDTGEGIEEKQFEDIFEPYVTNKAEGTGVGLAIVKRIAMEHSGSVRVESEIGKGTTFTVSIPRK